MIVKNLQNNLEKKINDTYIYNVCINKYCNKNK